MKKFLLAICSLFCVIGLAIGIGVSQANNGTQVQAETQTAFDMIEGARFRLMWTKEKCGIVFTGEISKSLVDTDKVSPKLLLVPQYYIDGMRTSSNEKYDTAKTYLEAGDYISALKSGGLSYKTVSPYIEEKDDDTYYMLGGIKTIQEHNLNRRFFGLYYYEDADGNITYASIPDDNEDNVSRSIVYLASGFRSRQAEQVTSDALATEMTDYFMTEGIKESVKRTLYNQNKSGSTSYTSFDVTPYFDTSVIDYSNDTSVKNTSVMASAQTSTVYDDYFDNYTISVNANGTEFAVGENLDFYVYVTDYDTEYFTQNGTYATEFESIKAGESDLTVALGKDSVTVPVTVSPYDISQATITTPTTQINYIEKINVSNINLTENYDSASYTPTYTLNISASGKILTDKTTVLSADSGTWVYNNIPNSGDQANATATLTGSGNFTGAQTSSEFDIKQNIYEIKVEYYYGADGVDANGNSKAGETAYTTQLLYLTYNSAYSVTSPTTVEGHTADTDVVSGTAPVGGQTRTVTYNVNTYTVTLNCQGTTVTHSCTYGSVYNIYTPYVEGYYTETKMVSNRMGATNVSQDVTYCAIDTSTMTAVESLSALSSTLYYWRYKHTAATGGGVGTVIASNESGNTSTYLISTTETMSGYSQCVSATNVYFETQFKIENTTTINDFWAKLGIKFVDKTTATTANCVTGDEVKNAMFYLDISRNSTTVDGTITNGGLFQGVALGVSSEYQSGVFQRPNSTDFTKNYVKLAVYKQGANFTFYIDDVQVYTTTINGLSGECYFGLMMYNVYFSTQCSYYKTGGSSTYTTTDDDRNFVTVNSDTFYYEATINASSRLDTADAGTKVGIIITRPAQDWQYFFYLDTADGKNTHGIGVCDIKLTNGTQEFYWYRARRLSSFSINTWQTDNVLSFYKTGKQCVFMINGEPVLERSGLDFSGANCILGVMAFNVSAKVSNVNYTTNTTLLNSLNKQRNIIAEDITVDGDLSDWTEEQKSTYYSATATDGSGRGFKTYARLGECGVYVGMEIKSKNCTKQDRSTYTSEGDTTAQDAALLQYWWRSFNVEFRVSPEYGSCACSTCQADTASTNVDDGKYSTREVARYVSISDVCYNVRIYKFDSSQGSDGYYTTYVEFIVPYGSISLDRSVKEVKMVFAVRTGLSDDGSDETVDGLSYWWTGKYNCVTTYNSNYNSTLEAPFVIRDKIHWLV